MQGRVCEFWMKFHIGVFCRLQNSGENQAKSSENSLLTQNTRCVDWPLRRMKQIGIQPRFICRGSIEYQQRYQRDLLRRYCKDKMETPPISRKSLNKEAHLRRLVANHMAYLSLIYLLK